MANEYQPPRPSGQSQFDRFLQWVWDMLAVRMRLIDTNEVKWEYSTRGIRPKIHINPGGLAGWRWADPKKYNSATSYSKNQIVIVGPGNAAIADGAIAGMWVCVQTPTIDPNTNDPVLPIWPPPGLTENAALDDPDNALIFWWPLNLYCA